MWKVKDDTGSLFNVVPQTETYSTQSHMSLLGGGNNNNNNLKYFINNLKPTESKEEISNTEADFHQSK